MHSTHFRVHLAALDWSPVGHPDRAGDRTGVPAVAVDAEGRAHVFVGNSGDGVACSHPEGTRRLGPLVAT